MSKPVDIKIAHINKNENSSNSIDKDLVHEVFQRYINDKLKLFYRQFIHEKYTPNIFNFRFNWRDIGQNFHGSKSPI